MHGVCVVSDRGISLDVEGSKITAEYRPASGPQFKAEVTVADDKWNDLGWNEVAVAFEPTSSTAKVGSRQIFPPMIKSAFVKFCQFDWLSTYVLVTLREKSC